MAAKTRIIEKFARMWPRCLFVGSKKSEWAAEIRRDLDCPGVYVLYRDEHPYYVGKTKGRLYSRIWGHANRPQTRLFNFWNFVSAFVVPESKHVDQVEGVLITTMPTANKATPKIKRIVFPAKAWKAAKKANP
jgi:hypothetical protein